MKTPLRSEGHLGLIDAWYVDTTDINKLTENTIVEMLRTLDPHSVYISAKDVKEMNEPLNGNFEGIGIQFNLLQGYNYCD